MSPTPPFDVIVSVQMPLLSSGVGYVTVDGFWQDAGLGVGRARWRPRRPPATVWSRVPVSHAAGWKEK